MGSRSKIEWTDHTWNPWRGCTPVSAGCANCYMFRDAARYGWHPNFVHLTSHSTLNVPFARDRAGAYKWAPGSRVFVCSWSDFWHRDGYRPIAWDVMRRRLDLIWILVTKRPQNIDDTDRPHLRNLRCWLLVSTENQATFDERWPRISDVDCEVRGISAEPLLGPLVLPRPSSLLPRPSWVITGGESGPQARPSHPDWFRSLRDQCVSAGIPYFFKQWGEYVPLESTHGGPGVVDHPDCRDCGYLRAPTAYVESADSEACLLRVGKKRAGRLLDGVEWSQFPEVRDKVRGLGGHNA